MNLIQSILRCITANMDAGTEHYLHQSEPNIPLTRMFLPTSTEQEAGRAVKRSRRRSRRTATVPFDLSLDPVTRARTEPRSRRADYERERRRRMPGTGNMPRQPGPLEADYDSSAVSPELKASGRITQLISKMKPLYAAGNRAAFDLLVPEFDWLANLLEDDNTWGITLRLQLFPDFVSDEDMDRETSPDS